MDLNIEYLYKNKKAEEDIFLKTTINDDIKIYYSIFLKNGDKISTPYEEIPFYFEELGYSYDLGDDDEDNNGTVIKGLDKTIMEMSLGDFVRVEIPYKYAYGEKGIPNIIPPKSNLIYYLRVIYIGRGDNSYECNNIINFKEIIDIDNVNMVKKSIEKLNLEDEKYNYVQIP